MNFNLKFAEYRNSVNKAIDDFFAEYRKGGVCETIVEAAEYAVKNGGKRVRPVLCLALSEILGVEKTVALKFAIAIEFIHSYSLVHDDLPAMDNDDFRRGKESTHKKFGEAIGILAGDALLNLAAETVLSVCNSESTVKAAMLLFEYSGMKGMIAGQVYDIESEKIKCATEDFLYKISENKTAKLLTAPLLVPAIIGGKYYEELKEYGKKIGVLFQITDDIFDATCDFASIGKTPHKDENKITAVNLFGVDGAKKRAETLYNDCKSIISAIPDSEFLIEFTDYIYNRKN